MTTKGFTSYQIGDQNALHFISFATVAWVDIESVEPKVKWW
jgi:hypothetical protein